MHVRGRAGRLSERYLFASFASYIQLSVLCGWCSSTTALCVLLEAGWSHFGSGLGSIAELSRL